MNKKVLYLFLALALPALIFVFLKFFGKNEFDVPVYFQDGMARDTICHTAGTGPYLVPDSVLVKAGTAVNQISVLVVYPFVKDDLTELYRIADKFKEDSVFIGIVSGMPNLPKTNLPKRELQYDSFGWLVTCGLRISEPWSVVLIDRKRQIRGFYDGSRRDEMDRLDLELSILLKKY